MKIIVQIGIVCALFWVSQMIETILPFTFPASVISLLLLLVLLLVKFIKVHQVQDIGEFLTGNMGFFFLPATVSIMKYVDIVMENAIAFFVVCILSMFITFAATAYTVTLTRKLMHQEQEDDE